ncbi:MAG: hypothetical protein Q6363_007790 [Candidatus Njordarchaeota archaeon]
MGKSLKKRILGFFFKKKKKYVGDVLVFPMPPLKDMQYAGSFVAFLGLAPFFIFFSLLIFAPDILIAMGIVTFPQLILVLIVSYCVMIPLYYHLERKAEIAIRPYNHWESYTKIGTDYVREIIRLYSIKPIAKPNSDKAAVAVPIKIPKRFQPNGGTPVAEEQTDENQNPESPMHALLEDDEEQEEAIKMEMGEKEYIVRPAEPFPPGVKVLEFGKYYYYLVQCTLGDEDELPEYRWIMSPFPIEELRYFTTTLYENGYFVSAQYTPVWLVHVGYLVSVEAQGSVPLFYLAFSVNHIDHLFKGSDLPKPPEMADILEAAFKIDKYQSEMLRVKLEEVKRERDLYKQAYENLNAQIDLMAEDRAADILKIWLMAFNSVRKQIRSPMERFIEDYGYFILALGIAGFIFGILGIFFL